MSDEIRVGDRFLVEVTIKEPSNLGGAAMCKLGDGYSTLISVKALLASKRLPRSITAGDTVRLPNTGPATVLCLDGDEAWLRYDYGARGTRRISDLTLADGETP